MVRSISPEPMPDFLSPPEDWKRLVRRKEMRSRTGPLVCLLGEISTSLTTTDRNTDRNTDRQTDRPMHKQEGRGW